MSEVEINETPEISKEEAESQELQPAFETAAEGEVPPENVWVPNRAERRAMKRNAKKGVNHLLNATKFAKGAALSKESKQELYKAAYEKLKDFKTEEYRHQAKG